MLNHHLSQKLKLIGRDKFNHLINMDNCIIGPCDWPKLQITLCGINMNSEIHVVGLIYKSIPEVKFR